MNQTSHRLGLAMAAITAMTWSILAIALKVALNYADSHTIVWFRFIVAAIGLVVILSIFDRKQLKILLRWPSLALLTGVLLAINYVGYMKGVELTSPSNAQVLIQTAPLMLILTGILFFKEKPTKQHAVGIICTTIGFALFFKDQLAASIDQRETYINGNLWIAVAAITWVLYAAFTKVLTRKWDPQQINLVIYLVSTAVLFPLADVSLMPTWSGFGWALMIFLGLNTLIAYGALGVALNKAPASQVSVIISINPLFTLLFMKILEWQKVTWIAPDKVSLIGYVGAISVVCGVCLVVTAKAPAAASD